MTLNKFNFSVYPSQPDYKLSEARIMSDMILLSLVKCLVQCSSQSKQMLNKYIWSRQIMGVVNKSYLII